MIMDWRELAGKPTVRGLRGEQRWDALTGVWSGGRHLGHYEFETGAWDGGVDAMRGWVIAMCWLAAFGVEYVSLPFSLRHVLLLGAHFPSNLRFWTMK
jgi:hypothetical protein